MTYFFIVTTAGLYSFKKNAAIFWYGLRMAVVAINCEMLQSLLPQRDTNILDSGACSSGATMGLAGKIIDTKCKPRLYFPLAGLIVQRYSYQDASHLPNKFFHDDSISRP